MGQPRQQRASRDRRRVTAQAPQVVPYLAAAVVGIVTTQLFLEFSALPFPPDTAGSPLPVILTGIPQLLRVTGADYPLSAVISPDSLTVTLTFPGPNLTPLDTFRLGLNDPSIRTNTGGFVAPGTLTAGAYSPANPISYTATATGTNDVTLNLDPRTRPGMLLAFDGWLNVGLGNTSSAVMFGPTSIVITFGAPVGPGDTIQYQGPPIYDPTHNLNEPSRAPVVCT